MANKESMNVTTLLEPETKAWLLSKRQSHGSVSKFISQLLTRKRNEEEYIGKKEGELV